MTRCGLEGRGAKSGRPQSVQAEEVRAQVETQAFQAICLPAVSSPCAGEGACRSTRPSSTPLTVPTVAQARPTYLYAKVAMARGTPILPGQVSLFRDGTFVGNGRRRRLGGGTSWASVSTTAVRVRHTIAEEKRAETGLITSSKTDTRSYRIIVKNLHERNSRHRHRPDPCRKTAISRSSCWASRRRSATSTRSAASSPGR